MRVIVRLVKKLIDAIFTIFVGGKTIEETEGLVTEPSEKDLVFLESLQFWPSWHEMEDNTLLELKEEYLDLLEKGTLEEDLFSQFEKKDAEYFMDALKGIYLSESER